MLFAVEEPTGSGLAETDHLDAVAEVIDWISDQGAAGDRARPDDVASPGRPLAPLLEEVRHIGSVGLVGGLVMVGVSPVSAREKGCWGQRGATTDGSARRSA